MTSQRPEFETGSMPRSEETSPLTSSHGYPGSIPPQAASKRLAGKSITQGRNDRVGGRLRPFFLGVALACVGALVVSLAVHLRVTGPLEQALSTREALFVASAVDGVIQARVSAVRVAAGNLEIENLTARGGLDRLLGNLREVFPDFLSLEVLNDQGQALAMMGDLTLSQAGRLDKMVEDVSRIEGDRVAFNDDPAGGCFWITLKHNGMNGVSWFSRTRFSRAPIDLIMKRLEEDQQVGLKRISGLVEGAGKDSLAAPEPLSKGVVSSPTVDGWWNRTITVDAPLAAPGWMVTVKKNSEGTTLGFLALGIPGILVLVSFAGFLVSRKPRATDHDAVPLPMSDESAQASNEVAVMDSEGDPLAAEELGAAGFANPPENMDEDDVVEGMKLDDLDGSDTQAILGEIPSPDGEDDVSVSGTEPLVQELVPAVSPPPETSCHEGEELPFDTEFTPSLDFLDVEVPLPPNPPDEVVPDTFDLDWNEPMQAAEEASPSHDRESVNAMHAEPQVDWDDIPESIEIVWNEPSPQEATAPDEEKHDQTGPGLYAGA